MYKVVRRERGQLVSVFAPEAARVVYRPGEWAHAPAFLAQEGYFLTAFQDLEDAVLFCNDMFDQSWPGEVEVWEAEAEGVVRSLPPNCESISLRTGTLVMLRAVAPWPRGTVMAMRIRLDRLVLGRGGREWRNGSTL